MVKDTSALPAADPITGQEDQRLQRVVLQLVEGGPERQAIEAGEIDAVIDYSNKDVILFPSAQHAVRADPPSSPESLGNSILAALPPLAYKRLRHALDPVVLTVDEVLYESGAPITYVYFPVDCVVSLLATVESSRILEVGLIGSEGMVGVSLALGVNISSIRALVSVTGKALRLPVAQFRVVYRQSRTLRHELYRYAYAELALARQTAACSAFHMIEQRLARRLLMIADRVQSDQFYLTHERVAHALGVRRESITEAAGRLQNRGLITYRRGDIRILNRRSLESASCHCYTRIKGLNDHIQTLQAVSQVSV